MSKVMKQVLQCDALRLDEPFDGPYFTNAMTKAFQYGTSNKGVDSTYSQML